MKYVLSLGHQNLIYKISKWGKKIDNKLEAFSLGPVTLENSLLFAASMSKSDNYDCTISLDSTRAAKVH